jgi:glycosyltransferase involved in cell wall biosynthesis
MRTLVDEPDLGRRLGEAGRRRVEAEFGVEAMVARFAALYEELAREKGLVF